MPDVINKTQSRLVWVDITKGLLIIFVVLGHAAGKFNPYIYQFHVGAFFLISGYTAVPEKKTCIHTVYHRFFTLYLPLVSAFLLFLLVTLVLVWTNSYSVFFDDSLPYVGVGSILREFFFHWKIYVWWLGATWFVLVLFLASIINRIVFKLCGDEYNIKYVLVILALFLVSYALITKGKLTSLLGLSLIAQFYYGLGTLFKRVHYPKTRLSPYVCYFVVLLISGAILWFVASHFHITMDWPSHRFNTPLIDAICVINGTLFTIMSAHFLAKIPTINRVFQYLGKRTLPIMLFHFSLFNVVFFILYKFHVVQYDYLQQFTPTADVGNKFWPLFLLVGIGGSLLVWKIMMKVKLLRIAFGQEKDVYASFYNRYGKLPPALKEKVNYWKETSKSKAISLYKNNRLIIVLLLVLICLISLPIILQGVTVNDELQYYQARSTGFMYLLQNNLNAEMRQGRPLRFLAGFNEVLGFLFDNIYLSRIVQYLMMLIALGSFVLFLHCLFEDFHYCLFAFVFSLVFIPITFEHATPNAFNGLVYIPMTDLFLSLAAYGQYRKTDERFFLVVSSILLIIMLFGYEFMVTFLPLFPAVHLFINYKSNKQWNEKLFKSTSVFAIISFLYLITLFISGKLFSGDYSGAKIGYKSLRSSLDIIWMLFRSALPGYWLFNSKYKYLFDLYNPGEYVTVLFSLPIVFLFAYIMWQVFKKSDRSIICDKKNSSSEIIGTLAVAFLYCFIPSIPNALSELYQGNVTTERFTALPVTAFLYVFACFIISRSIWEVKQKVNRIIFAVLILIMCPVVYKIQAMNIAFSLEQNSNIERIETISSMFETNVAKTMAYHNVYDNDISITKNALAIHPSFWPSIINRNGIAGLTLVDKNDDTVQPDFYLYEEGDEVWEITTEDEAVLLSKKPLLGEKALRIGKGKSFVAIFSEPTGKDGLFYSYHFIVNNDRLESTNTEPFSRYLIKSGNSLYTCARGDGFYPDGWVTESAAVQIMSGEEGIIHLEGYYPSELCGNEIISVYSEGMLLKNYSIETEIISFDIPVKKNQSVYLVIESNFSFSASPPDFRMLSFLITELEGK